MPTVQTVKIKDIKKAPYNPPNRETAISTLVQSIQEVGLIVPVLVDQKNNLVDGHRRVAAFRKLGLDEIPALVVSGDRSKLFSHVNANSAKFSGNQQLHIYLHDKEACGAKARCWLEEAEEVLGRNLLERMAKDGYSVSTYTTAKKVANEADKKNPDTLRKIVKWMMHFNCAGTVHKALKAGTPVGIILAAVERHKPIRPKFDVAK